MNKSVKSGVRKMLFCMMNKFNEKIQQNDALFKEKQECLRVVLNFLGLVKGITIINELDGTRFEQFLRRIISKLKLQCGEIFTQDEQLKLERIFNIDQEKIVLSIKTILYLFKRLLKYIFMPNDLKNDLKFLGLNEEKSEFIVKVWSAETRATLNDLGSEITESSQDSLQFSWKLNAELSSEHCKKSKIPKAYLTLFKNKDTTEMELTHPELYSIFLQFESIQNELDNII